MAHQSNLTLKNKLGLSFNFLENGLIETINANNTRISLKSGSLFSKAGTNIFLRKKENNVYKTSPILGPASKSAFYLDTTSFLAEGIWEGVEYTCQLKLSELDTSWCWTISTKNTTSSKCELDIIVIQDVGLKGISNALVNEYYVSQYIDRQILTDKTFGKAVFCRQNFKDADETPWVMLFCKNGAASASTDGIQFYGKKYRENGLPESLSEATLKGECAGELSIVAIQEKPFILETTETHTSNFIGKYVADHKEATSAEDLKLLQETAYNFTSNVEETSKENSFTSIKNKFSEAVFLPILDLETSEIDGYFSTERRHQEKKESTLLSFFYDENKHVVLKEKELLVDRPHGHILQAKAGYIPDESILSTTTYACGIFNSHITQGNTNFNRFLSLSASQFNLETETGQRIFVYLNDKWFLLGLPSAYEIGLNYCRWIYKTEDHILQIRTWTSKTNPQVNTDFKVLKGAPLDILITNNLDESIQWSLDKLNDNEYVSKPQKENIIAKKFKNPQFRIRIQETANLFQVFGNEILYADAKNHGGLFLNVSVKDTTSFGMSFLGEIVTSSTFTNLKNADQQFNIDCEDGLKDWRKLSSNLSLKGEDKNISILNEVLPWYGNNALTHLLTPHGLEQFDGAAWGTRDTTQGPFELLLCTEKYTEAKEILRIIFSHQNTDGGWPQWWMFDSYREIRAGSSHGDIHYWCIIALSDYIKATQDFSFLEEVLPYYSDSEQKEETSLNEHLERLIKMLIDSFVTGTAFVPFGGGDWNDSMQPASKALSERLISSWTVELNYQAFSKISEVYKQNGNEHKANKLSEICNRIKVDFNKYLIKDSIVAGHGLIEDDGTISHLLHPSDTKTNIQYRLLPMIRGIISAIFTKEQVEFHQNIIEQHLKGPDGARLMDRPPRYNGGIQKIFQRAESSSFFGREIGIMYMHAHLRYAQTLANTGKAELFIKALRQANPIAYKEVVSCADYRQSNCYYSSSDVTFNNRYEADEKYEDLIAGKVTVKGGWRIYSSGPGIYIGIIVSHLLGFRSEFNSVIIDPVIPKSFNGLIATINFKGYPLSIQFKVNEEEYHPKKITINNHSVAFSYQEHQYRKAGAKFETDYFLSFLNNNSNDIIIEL